MQLRMSTRTLDGVMLVDCSGRIVFGEESATLRDMVKKLVAKNANIVLNLREVNFIDSGGLGTLVSLYTTARNAGGAVKLASLSQRVGDLLQLTKLHTVGVDNPGRVVVVHENVEIVEIADHHMSVVYRADRLMEIPKDFHYMVGVDTLQFAEAAVAVAKQYFHTG